MNYINNEAAYMDYQTVVVAVCEDILIGLVKPVEGVFIKLSFGESNMYQVGFVNGEWDYRGNNCCIAMQDTANHAHAYTGKVDVVIFGGDMYDCTLFVDVVGRKPRYMA